MSGGWAGHLQGLVLFLGCVLLVALTNLVALRRLGRYGRPVAAPRASILVPARNEERSIERCVRSLLAQDYPDFEVVVLDDGSTDRTGAILAGLLREDRRLRVMSGQSLPAGWLGKHWACHQLAGAASGDVLLFVDADTHHHPDSLANGVAALERERAGLVTALPRQELGMWVERLVIPIMPWSVLAFLPLALAHRLRWPFLSAAVGQYMLFGREAYDAAGGHAAVRANVVDDFALARATKAAGLRWRLVDGTGRVEARMYRSAGEVLTGVSRSLYAVFNNLALHLFVWLWMGVAFLEPPVVLLLTALGVPGPGPVVVLAAVATLIALALWLITCAKFRLPLVLAPLYPAIVLAGVAIALRSALLSRLGRTTWKGRRIMRGS